MVFLELLSTLTQQVEQGCGEVIVERRGTEEENYGRVERHHTSNRDVLHGVLYPNAHVDRSKKKKKKQG